MCGALRYRVNDEALAHYACHCHDCQRRTGSAFALSLWVRHASLELLSGVPTAYYARLPDGREKAGKLCAACGTRLWGEPKGAPMLVLQAATLDQPAGLTPVAHLWTSEAQPWFVFPPGVTLFERQPDPAQLIALWKAHTALAG